MRWEQNGAKKSMVRWDRYSCLILMRMYFGIQIIELQIEVANLKSEKESLSRTVSRRDKMLLELQVQLQA